ncbi:hypothetical protein SCLCIDRAFT_130392, partial [Scleroderma citrinum Foug A]
PWQHSLVHYQSMIRLFSAPNGLCTSITESKHITAVKKPWWRSNKHKALGQILWTNQRLAQLAAARTDFEHRGMLSSREEYAPLPNACNHANTLPALSIKLGITELPGLVDKFLSKQLELSTCHSFHCSLTEIGRIKVFHSATVTFVSPSDPSGIGSMRREQIHAIPSWHRISTPPWYDCAFVSTDNTCDGMLSMEIARVLCFFSFVYTNGTTYTCTVVHWFDHIADHPDELTGMWMVSPSVLDNGSQNLAVIPLDSIVRGAHLLPIFGDERVPEYINFHNSLDMYRGFYINRFANHHAFELAS